MAADTDSSAVAALLDNLTNNIDGIESAIGPLLDKPLSTTSGKLPMLDKAKLYIHTAYAIESLLFSYLRLSGVDTKSHKVMSELGRVRSYFEKIKAAEAAGPSSRLDKGAANRFIKHALAGNDEYDRKKEEAKRDQEAKRDELAERYGKGQRFASMSKRSREDGHQSDMSAASEGGEQAAGSRKKSKKLHSSEEKRSSRYKKKLSTAPKDAHQAFKSLLSRGADKKQ